MTEPGPQTQEQPVWRFLRTGSRFAAANMALDEAILIAQQQQLVPPTLRFYSWQPAALSIGYFQQAGGSSPRPASSACFDTPSNYELSF